MLVETVAASQRARPRTSEARRVFRVIFSRGVAKAGAVVIAIFLVMAIGAPFIAPYDPMATDLGAILSKPSWLHLLGTDEVGRDLLSRLIYGARISLLVSISAVGIAGIVGAGLGLIAGYLGGWVNSLVMRVTDALLSFPPIVLTLAIATILGPGLTSVLIAIGIGMLPTYCRMMCAQVTSLKENDYILAARASGARSARIMISHLIPNAFPPLLVLLTINLGTAILTEASLSYLGIGLIPPTPSWGGMVSSGQRFLLNYPFLSLIPGTAVLLVVLAFNIVGDALRDALDPRLRGTL